MLPSGLREVRVVLPSRLLWAAMPTRVAAIATALLTTVAAALAWRRSVLWCASVLVVLMVVIILGAAVVALSAALRCGSSVASCFD